MLEIGGLQPNSKNWADQAQPTIIGLIPNWGLLADEEAHISAQEAFNFSFSEPCVLADF